jgi:serine O-acetyltransferase
MALKNKQVDKEHFLDVLAQRHEQCCTYPSILRVTSFFENLMCLLFPGYSDRQYLDRSAVEQAYNQIEADFVDMVSFSPVSQSVLNEWTQGFFAQLPSILQALEYDAQAMYDGDPAANSIEEVIRTYPGLTAIAAYRVAHVLDGLGITIVPRSITELAHSRTGIDIHPGATIGSHFCIDHGTGVVIGETTVIGDHVKIYQGVTLGALSVDKADADVKRHPTLEDHVIVYAGATILGGDTVIGEGSIVGGNVWLTRSLPPDSKVYYKTKVYDDATDETDLVIIK